MNAKDKTEVDANLMEILPEEEKPKDEIIEKRNYHLRHRQKWKKRLKLFKTLFQNL